MYPRLCSWQGFLLRLIAAALTVLLLEASGEIMGKEGEEVVVVASSSYWLKLFPTPIPLYEESMQILQSAATTALQTHITNQTTLTSQIDPHAVTSRMDWYEIQKVNVVFRAVIFGNVTDAYTCIALLALASVKMNRTNITDGTEYLIDSIRVGIDDAIIYFLGSSEFLGRQLSQMDPSNIANDVIVQLHGIKSVTVIPLTNSTSNGNMTFLPPEENDGHQKELLPWDIVLVTVSLVVLCIIVPLIARSRSSSFCQESSSHASLHYPTGSVSNFVPPRNIFEDDQFYKSELVEVFAQSNEVSDGLIASPSILTLTSYDNSNLTDLSNLCKVDEEYCDTDIMGSLDVTTSMMSLGPSSSSDDEVTTAHSGSSSSEDMIQALLSTASRTSQSSEASGQSSQSENGGFVVHHKNQSAAHEENKAALYSSSLSSSAKVESDVSPG